MAHGVLFRSKQLPKWRLPLEALQQIAWWSFRPYDLFRQRKRLSFLPWTLVIKACWLNPYEPSELAIWWRMGVRSWRELSRCQPENLSWIVHLQRRHPWPDQGQAASRLLADKASLLDLAPPCWRAPFLVLPSSEASVPLPSPEPPWWRAALDGPGVVIKPLRGHGGRAVIRFRWRAGSLRQHPLFLRLPGSAPPFPPGLPPTPVHLLRHWRRLFGRQDAALAAPYATHSARLPSAEPAVVVRVITSRDGPQAPAAVRLAWLEVPLPGGPVAFLHLRGACLPQPWTPLNPAQRRALRPWQDLLRTRVPPCVEACLAGAVRMHGRLPPIDQVAWDWIPADPHPLLLEGNASFGCLIPQLFGHLENAGGLATPCLAPSEDP